MPCESCRVGDAVERQFDSTKVDEELRRYRRNGVGPTTRLLRDGLAAAGLSSGDLLDVGGGFGALTFELLDRGMSRATVVDMSSAYLHAAAEEASRRGRASSVHTVHGDFTTVAASLPPAAVVALDRVVCCYPSPQLLLAEALRHAQRGFALSYPRDRWFVRVGSWLENALRRWRGNPFRTFVHSPVRLRQQIEAARFSLVSRRCTIAWCVEAFEKRA